MTHLPDNRQAKVVFESKDFCQRLRRIGNLVGRDRVFVGTVAFGKPAEAFILPAAALFIVAPVLVQGRNLKQIYDYSRTEDTLKAPRDAGRASSAAASRSLGTSMRKWLGFDN